MKIAAICNTDSLAIPALHFLKERGLLLEVGIPEKNAARLIQPILSTGIERNRINTFGGNTWKNQMETWLNRIQPDMVWVFTFPWKIPASMLQIPAKGFFNFHFGLLPKYKGADPVFWQIRNRESSAGLVVHRMTEHIDEGPVVIEHKVPLPPGETYGIHCMRMGMVAVGVAEHFLVSYENGTLNETAQQTSVTMYDHKPGEKELTINWYQQSAGDIAALIDASNPKYGGASAYALGMEFRILEGVIADVKDAPEVEPGTIVYADAVYGLIVACKDKSYLRINIVHAREGYLSGVKLFNMGIIAGEKFISNQPVSN